MIEQVMSMTGYAIKTGGLAEQRLAVELRSVNSRYLELQFRLPDEWRHLEPRMREMLQRRLHRGKVECRVVVMADGETAEATVVDPALLARLAGWQRQIRACLPDAPVLTVADVLRWPGALPARSVGGVADAQIVALLEQAMTALLEERQREGAVLAGVLRDKLADMQRELVRLDTCLPEAMAAWQQRMRQRFAELALGMGDERIAPELALFAQRMDIDEEKTRMLSHLVAAQNLLGQGGAVGKQLDFLAQEMNREANTMASKSVSASLTQVALALKILIEQVREQVQNIE